ncbi:enoyl-ACP reductase FabI [Rhodospirillum rubrum]|uniref:Enoyl-[acyl-carrier-protein] reductase [NADH] n=1 Tax=Rhodospirillum rubrum (strain ATCC 11170 / ATH 1.1.1 / DSM 467 / LMG 4362 / NCIMB 8255 / S1) TaxID=269796 RepID=Q2RPC4_RHORT|nr:enoyl-ACP reductase FabI [Rhodospirillum rubrum]ABC24021.1 Enoyl-[acyl-carrier-protein] reductase (NADH) [Rhodospirillum rubrum ATCC 11170]AEO49766.1 enoyl-(acyl carrier protein) reductase [Rhodospirillum rubrum F11]MBK5955705.1 enoyl-[acyl-carrier-protein] reductase [Rhodospirillum rubrum]QXG79964.1 enoyl-ACP reductase FabI [Rhodospirillum rubrum]HAP99033.1 enoyl-[acyl-carrier-protein] reductase FabI [Rhodospirillum rubrum]
MDTPFSLRGKKGLVVGIANDQSIAFGCARYFKKMGADIAVTYLNEKAKPYVEPLAGDLDALLLGPCDVRESGQLKGVFDRIAEEWGQLDFFLHSIAFAPKEDLHAPVIDCSREGFSLAMDVSCHSFVRMAKYAEPLMKNGGSMLTVTFYGGLKVVEHYNMMGPVKAALEGVTRYLAADLGPKGIRVNAISPGPLRTRAASGLDRFDELLEAAAKRAPQHQLVTIDDCGALAAFLVGDGAKAMTGATYFVDGGYNIMG